MTLLSEGLLKDNNRALLMSGLAADVTLSAEIMADTPVGYWRTIDGIDHSGNGLTLTPFGSPTAGTSLDASDPSDASITLNGTNNLWNPALYAALDFTTAVSLSFLFRPTGIGHSDLVTKGVNPPYGVYLDTGVLHAARRNGGSTVLANGGTTIVTNTTYHVGMSYDGTTVKLYLNGVLDGSSPATGTIDVANGNGFTIGLVTNGYSGTIDEIAVYGTALSAARFAAHAAAGL